MAENELTKVDDDDGGGGELLIPGPAPLTPREEQFCVAFGDPESVTYGRSEKSAAAAGYVQPRSAAWKLRRRPKIQARLAEFQVAATAAAGRVLSDLEHIRLLAIEKGDLATAARCVELAGKHLGLFLENSFLTLTDQADRPHYEQRVAEDTRRITAILLMGQDRPTPPVALEQGAAGAGAPGPVRATLADFDALNQVPQAPQQRQESES